MLTKITKTIKTNNTKDLKWLISSDVSCPSESIKSNIVLHTNLVDAFAVNAGFLSNLASLLNFILVLVSETL